jgi:hypothetical protein
MDREGAQARLDRLRTFNSELAALEQQGVLTLDGAQRRTLTEYQQGLLADLTRQFDLDRDDEQRRMSIGMRAASMVGAAALSAAVFLFFLRIWGLLATSSQIALLIAAPIAGVLMTEIADRRDRTRHFVFIAAVLACACIVLDVAMVGQIFAMTDSPNALAVWALFALWIGYAYTLRLPVAAGIVSTMAFVAGALYSRGGGDWMEGFSYPELWLVPAAAFALAGAGVTTPATRPFAPTLRGVGAVGVLAALWLLSIDARVSLLPWSGSAIKTTYQVAAFLVAGLTIGAGTLRGWRELVNVGAVALVALIYTKLYQWFWDWMPAYLFFLVVGLVAVLAIVTLLRVRAAAPEGRA